MTESFGIMTRLPTQDYPECTATLAVIRASLNANMGPSWGQKLEGVTPHSGADPVQVSADRLRRAMEIIHGLPIEDFEATRALLSEVETMLDREVRAVWELAHRVRVPRLPEIMLLSGSANVYALDGSVRLSA